MDEVRAYFREELNRVLFEQEKISYRIKAIDAEIADISEREELINSHEENPDYIFQADSLERRLDEKSLITMTDQKNNLQDERQRLKTELPDVMASVDKFKSMFDTAEAAANNKLPVRISDKLQFIAGIIDSDPQRAKVELLNILKEEQANAN